MIWLLLIAAAGMIIHLITYNSLGFHRDELLYLALGKHLSAGYWSNPPLIGFISYAAQQLPFNALFSIRLIAALAGAVVVILTGLTARELGGSVYSMVLAAISLSCSIIFLRAFSMFQPVPFDILFWTLTLYFLLRYIRTKKPLFVILTGASIGLGFLNKYMLAFLVIALVASALLTKHRKLLWNKYTGMALFVAFSIFLPNLIWQYIHGFPVIKHMQELADTQLVNVSRLNTLIEQLLMFTIISVVWIAGLLWLFSSKAKEYRLFGIAYLIVLAMILVGKGKNYYMAGMYPFLLAAGGVAWESMIKVRRVRNAFIIGLILLSLPFFAVSIPFMKADKQAEFYEKMPQGIGLEAITRWEDGNQHPLPQDFADMLGWDELGKIVVNTCDTIADKERIMIFAENYGQAGAIDLAGNGKLPEAVSFSDSYVLWAPDTISQSKNIFIYVNHGMGDDVKSMFTRIDRVGSITQPLAREFGCTVYLCRDPNPQFRAFWLQQVKEIKDAYLK